MSSFNCTNFTTRIELCKRYIVEYKKIRNKLYVQHFFTLGIQSPTKTPIKVNDNKKAHDIDAALTFDSMPQLYHNY